jgi:hypothetical protein
MKRHKKKVQLFRGEQLLKTRRRLHEQFEGGPGQPSVDIDIEFSETPGGLPELPRLVFDRPVMALTGKADVRGEGGTLEPYTSANLFTKTSKMSALSFSLPAGGDKWQGTCPAEQLQRATGNYMAKIPTDWKGQGVEAQREKFICAACYAGKGQYPMDTTQMPQLARLYWVKNLLAQDNGPVVLAAELIRALTWATAALQRQKRDKKDYLDPRFFRIHDSGDFFGPDYYEAWKIVCHHFTQTISFWAPTREWVHAQTGMRNLLRDLPPNLALRPSAIHVGDPAPQVPGMSAGTTVALDQSISDWNCPVYSEVEGEEKKSCRGALDGQPPELAAQIRQGLGISPGKDCRVCWVGKRWSVNYSPH